MPPTPSDTLCITYDRNLNHDSTVTEFVTIGELYGDSWTRQQIQQYSGGSARPSAAWLTAGSTATFTTQYVN